MDHNAARIYNALLEYRGSRLPPESVAPEELDRSVKTNQAKCDAAMQGSRDIMIREDAGDNNATAATANIGSHHSHGTIVQLRGEHSLPEPAQFAAQFAAHAATLITNRELELLVEFLKTPIPISGIDLLRATVRTRIQKFYEDEIEITNEPRERLSAPSGPEDAEIGIVLHCQSKEDDIGEFWDPDSRTIQLLSAKGVRPDFIYGFDWHWRAEESATVKGRGDCPYKKWPDEKRLMHDNLSSDVLKILPLPWLLIGGSCVREKYEKTTTVSARRLSISVPGIEDINIDIVFQEASIKRIVAYIPHPTAGIWHPTFSANYAAKLDICIDFFLWLHGREFKSGVFTSCQTGTGKRRSAVVVLPELYRYRKTERELGRNLAETDFSHSFLRWGTKSLQEEPSEICSRGESVIDSMVKTIGTKISVKAKARFAQSNHQCRKAGTRSAAKRYGHTIKQFWDGEHVRITQKGTFKIFVHDCMTSLELRGGLALKRAADQSSDPVVIHFLEDGIELSTDGKIIFQQALGSIKDEVQRKLWSDQYAAETKLS